MTTKRDKSETPEIRSACHVPALNVTIARQRAQGASGRRYWEGSQRFVLIGLSVVSSVSQLRLPCRCTFHKGKSFTSQSLSQSGLLVLQIEEVFGRLCGTPFSVPAQT